MVTILLVDDSRVSREVIKVFLIGRGFRLLEAVDGERALSMMHEYHPNLVLADLEMPKLDGIGLCKAIRSDPRLSATPIVMLSGTVTPETAALCRAAGALDVLSKPVQPQKLLASIDRHLPASPAERGFHL